MFGLWKQLQYSRKPVTTNQSEGMNTVIKNLIGWREAPMDSRIRVLYNKFQGMYIRIIKSRYTSHPTPSIRNLKNLYKNEDRPNLYFDVVPFEEIVNRYREPASIFKKVK